MEEALSGIAFVIVVMVILWMRRTRVFDDPDADRKRGTWSQFTDAFWKRTPQIETLPDDDLGGSPHGNDDRQPEDERPE
jgi:hypothetical protein